MKEEHRDLLKNRAREMAKVPEQTGSHSEDREVVSFMLGSENYGLESAYVREVYQIKDFTPLPGVPPHIFGLINIRGQILPVIDLKNILNLPDLGLGELNKVIILHDDQMEFGILADVVHGTRVLKMEEIREVPDGLAGKGKENLKGITCEGLILLNAGYLLADITLMVNEEI